MRVAVTGASGFIGSALVRYLLDKGDAVHACQRTACHPDSPQGYQGSMTPELFSVGDLNATTNWQTALKDCDVVVHAAARVHVMQDNSQDPLSEYRRVNVEGTLRLAQQAIDAGVKRLIFLSSIKVNGEATERNARFSVQDTPKPTDPYAISKFEAEQALLKLGQKTGLEVVIIRLPLVYGPGVKANFRSLISLVKKGLPLPFASIKNKRRLLGLSNCLSLIYSCCQSPQAAGQRFLAGDAQAVTTGQLCQAIGQALGKPARQLFVPEWLFKLVGHCLGKQSVVERLFGSLDIDIEHTKQTLGWLPEVSLVEELKATVRAIPFPLGERLKGKRAFDLLFAMVLSLILALPLAVVALMVKFTSPGPILYWSDRVGKGNTLFRMPKFRTMRTDTPEVATHLLQDPASFLTPIGRLLRSTSLDELPQLWNIFKGDMSFVGPRPALFNQADLIALRTEKGVEQLSPGITGWAQVNGRDELAIPTKVALDAEYKKRHSFRFDLKILWLTFVKVAQREGVQH